MKPLGLLVWLTAGRLIKNWMQQVRKTGERLSALNWILLATIKQPPWTGRGKDFLRTTHRLQEEMYPWPHLGPTAVWFLLLPRQSLLRHFIALGVSSLLGKGPLQRARRASEHVYVNPSGPTEWHS